MSDIISYSPVRAIDGNGDPVPGALARFFRSNTSTPATVFADVAEQVPHPVPLEADGNGVFPPVYRSGVALRVNMTTPDGVMLPGFPLDPVIAVAAAGGAAASISFDPTSEIPATNVQAAIERVQLNLVAPLLAGGLGVTGNGPVLNNVDATNTASGFYRWTDAATGTLPPGWAGETGTIWLFRETPNDAIQFVARRDVDALFFRRLVDGTFTTWVRYDLRSLPNEDWEEGTRETFASPSPKQIADAVRARGLTPEQAEDDESDVIGPVTGELLAGVFDAREQQIGVGQTWQNVSGSRSGNTSYQNTTGKPIWVGVVRSTSNSLEASANGSSWLEVSKTTGSGAIYAAAIIPSGWFYRFTGGFSGWVELR